MKKSLVLLLSLGLITSIFSTNVYADSASVAKSEGTFTSIPGPEEIERQKQYQLEPPTAWEYDSEGNKIEVPYKDLYNSDEIGTFSWSDSNYTYVFDSWVLNNTKKDPLRFYVSEVSVENRAYSGTLPLSYKQTSSVTTDWSVNFNINFEGDLKVKFLASLKANLGGSYNYTKNNSASSTIEIGPVQVPARTIATFKKYNGGAYGAGQAAWKKYIKGSASQVGMHYTGESGWAIDESSTRHVYSETKI